MWVIRVTLNHWFECESSEWLIHHKYSESESPEQLSECESLQWMRVSIVDVCHRNKCVSCVIPSHWSEHESSEWLWVTSLTMLSEWLWFIRVIESPELMWVLKVTESHWSDCESLEWMCVTWVTRRVTGVNLIHQTQSSEWSSEWMWLIKVNESLRWRLVIKVNVSGCRTVEL